MRGQQRRFNCLFVYPPFTSQSFWNYRQTCELIGARYPAAPLGLVTIAAMLPESWHVKLVDCNIEPLEEKDILWADLIFSGGMIAQQTAHLDLIEKLKRYNKVHIVGGPDATSSPHVYDQADHLVLGEAEVTLPEFLRDLKNGRARHLYEAGDRKADMSKTPIPRFDLLKFDRYLHVGIQFARGCPFKCEFCDIIELYGRVPRVKTDTQILNELQQLYDLGYRGHVDFVDDNFIGNKKAVKVLLPKLSEWLKEHRWPFEFSTEASINLADDVRLMALMQEVGFSCIFVGIESPDEETLISTQKKQNTRRSIPQSIEKIYQHGMFVNAGYIVGLDGERGSVAKGILRNIEETAIPVNMTGLLFALPNTQLSRRLAKEGRLQTGFEVVAQGVGDQCLAGLNFETQRPRREVLEDYKKVVYESYKPENYFNRVERVALNLDCSKKRLHLPLKTRLKDLRGLFRLIRSMGVSSSYRKHFWQVLLRCLLKNPKAIRYAVALMALYLHFGPFSRYIADHIRIEIERLRRLEREEQTVFDGLKEVVAISL